MPGIASSSKASNTSAFLPLPRSAKRGTPPFLRAVIIVVIEVDAGERVVALLKDALPDHLFDRTERSDRRRVRQPLDGSDAVLLENALHPADGVALAIQQATDTPEQVDVIGR